MKKANFPIKTTRIKLLGISLFILFLISTAFFFIFPDNKLVYVTSDSMYPTIHKGDVLLIHEMGTIITQSDIIVIKRNDVTNWCSNKGYIVKRVIAIGGQTIEIDHIASSVYVDGIVINEPYVYLEDNIMLKKDGARNIQIPQGYVYVMGDNRNNSFDSRNSEMGLIRNEDIIGIVLDIFSLRISR